MAQQATDDVGAAFNSVPHCSQGWLDILNNGNGTLLSCQLNERNSQINVQVDCVFIDSSAPEGKKIGTSRGPYFRPRGYGGVGPTIC